MGEDAQELPPPLAFRGSLVLAVARGGERFKEGAESPSPKDTAKVCRRSSSMYRSIRGKAVWAVTQKRTCEPGNVGCSGGVLTGLSEVKWRSVGLAMIGLR